MGISKKNRDILFQKYGGKCAYCGCDLQKGWHADHIEAVIRNSHYNPKTHRWEFDGTYVNPEKNHIDNMNPSCASCNINKHQLTIEQFRDLIQNFVSSLNEYTVQYKIAKRYGLIQETEKKVRFYFEDYRQNEISKHKNHLRFKVSGAKLYELYSSYGQIKSLIICDCPGIADTEVCSEDMIKYIESEFL
ncbi:HNH endonuclease signature motif containing protein [Epilithonimonas sp.]|uniref:HNH endonuclease signature motif containing protein n=1 Tax=Epilithonimonas sp. TaxID=2894511 RepID=UPI0035B1EFE3